MNAVMRLRIAVSFVGDAPLRVPPKGCDKLRGALRTAPPTRAVFCTHISSLSMEVKVQGLQKLRFF